MGILDFDTATGTEAFVPTGFPHADRILAGIVAKGFTPMSRMESRVYRERLSNAIGCAAIDGAHAGLEYEAMMFRLADLRAPSDIRLSAIDALADATSAATRAQ